MAVSVPVSVTVAVPLPVNEVRLAVVARVRLPWGTLSAHAALPSDLAFLQYTSGSTGDPKGVMITRDNLAWSCRDLGAHLSCDDACHLVSWLPAFHDFGLVWGLMTPIFGGFPVTFMLPTAFLQRPARWLEAITRFAGTHTAAPNFSFDLVAAKTGSDVLRRLDLSSLRFVGNGSEPVRASTIETFLCTFGPAGLRAEALCPDMAWRKPR